MTLRRPWGRRLGAVLGLALALGTAQSLGAEDRGTAEVRRILGDAEAAAGARWSALVADDRQGHPLVTWEAWGRGDGSPDGGALAVGGLGLSTPWITLQTEARQNPAPLGPGASLSVEVPLADGYPGGRGAAWGVGRDLADRSARLEAVNEFRRAVAQGLERLRTEVGVWIDRENRIQTARELSLRLEEMDRFPDRFSDRNRDQTRRDAARLALVESAEVSTPPGWVEGVLSEPQDEPSLEPVPVLALWTTNPEDLEQDLQTRQETEAAARRSAGAWPTLTLTLGASAPVGAQGGPGLQAGLRVSGSFGDAPPTVVTASPVERRPRTTLAQAQARVLLAQFDQDGARRHRDQVEADNAQAARRRQEAGSPDVPRDLAESRAQIEARAGVLRAWLAWVEARVALALP